MTIVSNGQISIQDIATEFSGTPVGDYAPHGLFEYYRDPNGVTTENNTGVPLSGEITFKDFYGTIRIITKIVTANTTHLVMTSLFNSTELNSGAPLQVIINSGITVGSTSTSIPAIRTGTGNTGTLTLVNNGWVYGAPGPAGTSTTGFQGGPAFKAETAVTVDNTNGRLWAGGGGGGKAGKGADGYWYFDNTNWKYQYPSPYLVWQIPAAGRFTVAYTAISPTITESYYGADYNTKSFYVASDGYYYEKGTYVGTPGGGILNYRIRRRTNTWYAGGAGGNGGIGQGYNQSNVSGNTGVNPTHAGQGGTGGTGGTWGTAGGTGANGNNATDTYHTNRASPLTGYSGGAAGDYAQGNASITWTATGSVAGGTS